MKLLRYGPAGQEKPGVLDIDGRIRDASAISGDFAGDAVSIDDDTRDGCPLFAGRVIRGLRNGPSPAWLQDRLRAIGLRPISALVDITNFINMDHARPLHVYDADKNMEF